MRSQKIKGIIISKRSFGEKDYALTVLTPDSGKILATVKGAREIKSKFTGHVDLMNVCDFEMYMGPNYTYVSECQINKNFSGFSDNLKKFYYASLVSKILNRYTTENENSHEIYELALDTFFSIEKYNKEELIYEGFKIKACQILGLMPDINGIENIELEHLNQNIKNIIYFMHTNNYEEINNLKLDKSNLEKLKQTTQKMLEHTF